MIILGVDPGTRLSAWAQVDMSGRRPLYVCGGMVESAHLCHVCSHDVDGMRLFTAAYIEQPVPPHPGGKADTPQARIKITRDLMATALVAGEALGVAGEHCAHVDYLTSHAVRRSLCGNAHAEDAEVKAALALQCDGLPKRSNNHVRDAIAVAIVGAWKFSRVARRHEDLDGAWKWERER